MVEWQPLLPATAMLRTAPLLSLALLLLHALPLQARQDPVPVRAVVAGWGRVRATG